MIPATLCSLNRLAGIVRPRPSHFSRCYSTTFAPQSPSTVEIIEVSPRDGLQNEKVPIPTEMKLNLIDNLASAGLKRIEASAFVSPKWVPQMSDQNEVMASVPRDGYQGLEYEVLTPNLKGYQAAKASGADRVSVFGAASEGFCRSNINCTIDESIERFSEVIEAAKADGIKTRGYISCIAGCPFQGDVDVKDVVRVYEAMKGMGIEEISLGDTIGVGRPQRVSEVLSALQPSSPSLSDIAMHFHDTYGMGIANVLRSLDFGVNKFDSSAAGLGGCPYAGGGASGNLATEDLVYLLDGLGVNTGVDLEQVVKAGEEVTEFLKIETRSKVGGAIKRKWIKEANNVE